MKDEQMLISLKADLGINTTAYDVRLRQYINAAKTAISTEGITLDMTDDSDCNLVILYAAHLWRKRDSGEGLPRMIRWLLNNRLFSEKTKEETDG